jgi:hypothetical protein
MHSVYIYVAERLRVREAQKLKKELMHVPYVTNVELNPRNPHELVVEYVEHAIMPMIIQQRLRKKGLHTDVCSG